MTNMKNNLCNRGGPSGDMLGGVLQMGLEDAGMGGDSSLCHAMREGVKGRDR